ncbi:guanylate kinase [Paucilactobacillus suebicus]|uniref:Guanylate kinase n=1 Tax=Paucilactobacillus suebicus DSM 5007 = KCTC 3549 TaxID=1423807 RepID=A0A0R1W5G6_9LACO|nr:guanylate kinase [Paucilactobacillus suebicus]KRM13041.1 guanylate kinase [Paucilactobacillus suebicus DSM 5007 = KCTC 3549]
MKHVLIVTGAAGSGKTTVSGYLNETYHIPRVITHTTRKPRDGEVNGVDYYFETRESMDRLHLLEQVEYDHNLYGSSYEGLEKAWAHSELATIVLDTKGAQTYRKTLGEKAVVLFLTVTKRHSLVRRLAQRGDLKTAVKQRIASAEYHRDLTLPDQLSDIANVIVNDDWEKTKMELDKLVKSLEH